MGKNSKGHCGFGGGGLDHEDFLLWKAFTRDIDPLEDMDWTAAEDSSFAATPQPDRGRSQAESPPADVAPRRRSAPERTANNPQPVQLDARTEARLRRGKMPVEGRLDLHGCTQDQAHTRLNRFVGEAYANGKRCVLVITGKGSSRNEAGEYAVGVLRQKLPLWLSLPPLREMVLKSFPAVQRDGGGGAWYLYLKRQRDY